MAIPTIVEGLNIIEVGLGHHFATVAEYAAWLKDKDLVTLKAKLLVHLFGDDNPRGLIQPLNSSTEYNIEYAPGPGMGYRDLATAGLYDYPNAGVEWRIYASNPEFNVGVKIRGMRIRFPAGSQTAYVNMGYSKGDKAARTTFVDNRIMVERNTLSATRAFIFGQSFTSMDILNNVFISIHPGIMLSTNDNAGNVLGNTFVARDAAVGNLYMSIGSYGGAGLTQNNAFYNCGPNPIRFSTDGQSRHNQGNFLNNYTNNELDPALVTAKIGLIVDTVKPFFLDPLSDLRPAKDGALYGMGNDLMRSTMDAAGSNRGFDPDVGAFQLEPASNLPVVEVTTQDLQGQILKVQASLLNGVTRATFTLPPDVNDARGASQLGPFEMAITGEVGDIEITVPVGQYGPGVVEAHNAGGKKQALTPRGTTVQPISVSAYLADHIGIANSVLARGRPVLPVFVGNGQVPDTKPPKVQLSVNSQSFIAKGALTLTAAASDNRAVTKVEFYRGAELIHTTTQAPYVHNVNLTNADNGEHEFSARAYDAAGNVATTAVSKRVKVRIPPDGSPVPTIVAMRVVAPAATSPRPYVEVEFSTAMDKDDEFDFPGQAFISAGPHFHIVGTEWVKNSDRKLSLIFEEYSYPLKDSTLSVSYTKTVNGGWRSAEGVLVESFSEYPVETATSDHHTATYSQTADGKVPGTPLAGTTWDVGGVVWLPNSHFVVGNEGDFVPSDATTGPRINGGIYQRGNFESKQWAGVSIWYAQSSFDVSFVKRTLEDSPYGMFLLGKDTTDTDFGPTGVKVEVNNAGTLTFEQASSTVVPGVYDPIPGTALEVGKEYTLSVCRHLSGTGNSFAVQFGESVNGEITNVMHSYHFQLNAAPVAFDYKYNKVYTINAAGPYAKAVRVGGKSRRTDAKKMVYPKLEVTDAAETAIVQGVTASGTGPITYTGTGQALTAVPGIVLKKMFANNVLSTKRNDNGIAATLGATVENIYLGIAVSGVKDTVDAIRPVEKMLMALRATSIGGKYEVYVAARRRTTIKSMSVEAGDQVRVRTVGEDIMFEVKKAAGDWVILYRQTMALGGRADNYLVGQILIPMGSVVTDVRQK